MQCPNCDAPIDKADKYCWNCGQKNKQSRIKLTTLLKEALEQISNLDAAFFKTIHHLFIPGKLPLEFFKGKRKRYVTPFRFFFIAAIIHFALLGYISSKELNPRVNTLTEEELYEKGYRDLIVDEMAFKIAEIKAEVGEDSLIDLAFNALKDSMSTGNHYFIASFNSSADTSGEDGLIQVPYSEIISNDAEDLALKYGMERGMEKLQFIQQIKMVKDPK